MSYESLFKVVTIFRFFELGLRIRVKIRVSVRIRVRIWIKVRIFVRIIIQSLKIETTPKT